jgi:glutaminyl-peptide cyclotransferase
MRLNIKYIALIVIFFSVRCTEKKGNSASTTWNKPEAGTAFNLGDKVALELQLPEDKVDSIVYYSDSVKLVKALDNKAVSISTDSLSLGIRSVTAKIYRAGKEPEEAITNMVLKSALVPQKFGYEVKHVFNHDTASFTEGLEFHDGSFYESDGGNDDNIGYSSLRRVEPSTGKVLQKTDIDKKIFAEGIAIIGDKILQLTYKENIGFVYDLKTLKLLEQFQCQNSREGWGLCFDGQKIYNSDGSNNIYFLNKDTYRQEGYIEVYDQNGPVKNINELEYIDGKIYANIWESDRVVIINPKNGQVTGEIDLSKLYPSEKRNAGADVLNGIAYDKKDKRLFVTGKKWDKLFEIKLSE